jgi:hypothetical protein
MLKELRKLRDLPKMLSRKKNDREVTEMIIKL